MGFNIKRYSEQPAIFVIEVVKPFDFVADMHAMYGAIQDARQGLEGKLSIIFDLRRLEMTFSELVVAMDEQRRGHAGSMTDPSIQTLIAASDDIIKMGAKGMGQEQYGGVDIPLYESVEAALAHVQAKA
jgi:hypothetical protein